MTPSLEVLDIDPKPTLNPYSVNSIKNEDGDKNDLVLKVFRCLIADLCEQFKGGHPGYDPYCCVVILFSLM